MDTNYAGTLVSSRQDGKLAYTDNIYDKSISKMQSAINQEVRTYINSHNISVTVEQGKNILNINGQKFILTPFDDTPIVIDTKVYYGKSSTIPSNIGSSYITLNNGENLLKVEGYAKVLWIAVPSGLTVTVTGKDYLGLPVTIQTNNSQIDGYIVYYRQADVQLDECNFTIVYQNG